MYPQQMPNYTVFKSNNYLQNFQITKECFPYVIHLGSKKLLLVLRDIILIGNNYGLNKHILSAMKTDVKFVPRLKLCGRFLQRPIK